MNPKNTDITPILEEGATTLPVDTTEEIKQLASTDPVAAVLANVPHQARSIAERVLASSGTPERREERSPREVALGRPARIITRDFKHQLRFLRGRFYPMNGERERARRIRQMSQVATAQ